MMKYREIKNALTTLLGDNAGGRFRVIGYQRQTKNADEMKASDRMVQVYFSDGAFPKTGGMRGAKKHDITIEIDLSASATAKADLTVLNSDTATAQQKAAALQAVKFASEEADELMDDLIDIVWNIILDARNERLGLPIGDLSNRWIDRIQKDTLLSFGDLVTKTANMKYTCRVDEEVQGDIGVEPAQVIINSDIPIAETDGAGVLNIVDNI